jgi:glycosyltransferase involved in cell wall biosynthesis
MRILQVVHGFLPERRGGTEIYTYNLSKELSKNHEVHIFYPRRIKRARGSSPAQYENAFLSDNVNRLLQHLVSPISNRG